MSDRIVYLKPPERNPSVKSVTGPAIVVGRQYRLDNDDVCEDMHGLCAGLDYNLHHGHVLPASTATQRHQYYLWDIDEELDTDKFSFSTTEGEAIALPPMANVLTSHFVISHCTLREPQIIDHESTPQLTATAGFEFVFSTQLPAVRLGMLSLVESQCFAQLKNGERHILRDNDNEQPRLYLPAAGNQYAVPCPILDAESGMAPSQDQLEIRLAWSLPQHLDGQETETLTVQEQYTSFFMQRELPFSQDNIWTPVCAPISWGWSMRVAKRSDGDWCIVRQKLLTPAVGHNGLVMPEWEGNIAGH